MRSRVWSIVCLPCALVVLAAVPACGGDEDGEAGAESGTSTETTTSPPDEELCALIDHDLWTALEADADPFAAHRPDTIDCGIAGWYVEGGRLEVDTNFCNYLGVGQPSLGAIEVGDTLHVGAFHFDLAAPEPALAHLALAIDGETVWEQEIQIPGAGQVFDEYFPSPVSAPAGAPIVAHLHNHGQNTWIIQALDGPCGSE